MASNYLNAFTQQGASPQGSMGGGGGTGIGGADMTQVAGAGAAGFMAGGPWGAAIGAGGSFLSQYLAQRAQEEENRKKALQEAQQNQGSQQQSAFSNLGSMYGRALGV